MENNYTDVMSARSDEELIKIVTMQREDYQPDAVIAAEVELKKRNISSDKIEAIKSDLTAKDEKQSIINTNIVSQWIRLIHFIVDFIAFCIIFIILGTLIGYIIHTTDQLAFGLINYSMLLISFFAYFVFMEFKYQKTIGKFLTKTKVVLKDGQPPLLNDIIIRTLCRLIPLDQFSFIFTRNGFHDYLSNTTVIKE
jgi:uncharacterized RDD family membrane protein YckC